MLLKLLYIDDDKNDYEIFEETIHEINPHAEVMYTEDSNK
jgi:hypothetical protein